MKVRAILVVLGMLTATVITSGYYPIAQYLAVSPSGTGLLLRRSIFIAPICFVASLVLAIVSALLVERTYRLKGACFLFVVALIVVSWPLGLSLGNHIRHSAFASLAERSRPLINAIEEYKSHTGMLPNKLDDLVPAFLPEVPGTGMSAYPLYLYGADGRQGSYWLYVKTPGASIMNLDEFRHSSNGQYPDYGKHWEVIGEWQYYHE